MGRSRCALVRHWLFVVLACAVTFNAISAADSESSPPSRVVTAQRAFVIPFELEAPREPSLAANEVRLHLSQDQGATWQLVDRANPQTLRFNFRAPSDGEYWFSLQTVDRQGRAYPDGEHRAGLIVVVDSTARQKVAAENSRSSQNAPATSQKAPTDSLPRAQPWPADATTDVPVERNLDRAAADRSDNARPSPAPVHSRVAQRVAAGSATGGRTAGLDNLPPGEQPRFKATRHLRLACDIEGAEHEELKQIELWQTADGCATWRCVAALGSSNPSSGRVFEIEAQQDGLYGFRMASSTKRGETERPPQPSDAAQVWVFVDTEPPHVQITAAKIVRASPGGPGAQQLEIEWQAEDAALADRPITLAYSATPGGPWTTFAAGLANQRRYVWALEGRVPRRVYLQIEARDRAGNVSRQEPPEPVDVTSPGGIGR